MNAQATMSRSWGALQYHILREMSCHRRRAEEVYLLINGFDVGVSYSSTLKKYDRISTTDLGALADLCARISC